MQEKEGKTVKRSHRGVERLSRSSDHNAAGGNRDFYL